MEYADAVFCVDGGHGEVAGFGCEEGCLDFLWVSDFADEDDSGALAECAVDAVEVALGVGAYFSLDKEAAFALGVVVVEEVFDGLFDGDDDDSGDVFLDVF